MITSTLFRAAAFLLVFSFAIVNPVGAQQQWLTYPGGSGPGEGKKVVLISGDEEYRSEEALPMLARILSTHHGFTCTVHFAINPDTGFVDPNYQRNIPGLEELGDADLMVIFTRFRRLPDEQMKHVDDYLKSGRPVIGLRTSTHAFELGSRGDYAHYSNSYNGEKTEWKEGFGRLVLGEKWISHHGQHKHESARGILNTDAADHAILRGIADGSIWGPSDVYGVRLPLPGDSLPLVYGQVVARDGEYDDADLYFGMRDTDMKAVPGEKNDPMMPMAWTKSYQLPGGEEGKVFTTTMGASTDLMNPPLRRLIVNAAYWAAGLGSEIPEDGTKIDIVGSYSPTQFSFTDKDFWTKKGLKVSNFR